MSIQEDKLKGIANSIRIAKQEKDHTRKIVADTYPQEIEGIPQAYSKYFLTKNYIVELPPRYGVKFDKSSSKGIRMFNSENAIVNVSSKLDVHVQNDFENYDIFKDITYPVISGNYFTRIPMFYSYKPKECWKLEEFVISPVKWNNDYDVDPAFITQDGKVLPYIDLPRFQTSNNNQIIPNSDWTVNLTRKDFRNYAKRLGNEYCLFDINALTLLKKLWLIVTANKNSKQVMLGNISGAKKNTGESLNSASTLYSSGRNVCSFFGIENPFTGGFYFVDGVIGDGVNNKWFVSKDLANYSDTMNISYNEINDIPYNIGNGNISKLSISTNSDYAALPSEILGDSSYYSSVFYKRGIIAVMIAGGSWFSRGAEGMFYTNMQQDGNYKSSETGSRIVHYPLSLAKPLLEV